MFGLICERVAIYLVSITKDRRARRMVSTATAAMDGGLSGVQEFADPGARPESDIGVATVERDE